jgi:hypothetical protein
MSTFKYIIVVLILTFCSITINKSWSQAWNLSGNPGINPTTDFIGTSDNNPLSIKTNNTEVVFIRQ